MKSARARLLLASLLLLTPLNAAAAPRAECATVKSKHLGRPVRYCALLPPSYDTEKSRRYPVLYHLHGLGDSEQSFVNGGGWNLLEELQTGGKVSEFITVTPDGGRSFYVNSKSGRMRYEDFFIREFLPAIEAKYRVAPGRTHRGIGGISMGGYGALRLAFKYPQLFGSVSAHSAALMQTPPRGIASATGTRLDILGNVFGSPLDREFYDRASPFTLARQNAAALRATRIYFDSGLADEYGFDRGARALHELLASLRIPHEFHLYPGGHSWSYFAERLDDSFLFHSRAFAR